MFSVGLFPDQGVAGDRIASAPLQLRFLSVSFLGAAGTRVYRPGSGSDGPQQQRAAESGGV